MRKLLLPFIALMLIWPATASAQTGGEDEDSAIIRVNSDAVIGPDETIENLVVISADARIEGTVTGTLVVIDGDATVSGRVGDDLIVISGDITLQDGSTVNNVNSIRGDLTRAPGATVTGDIDENDFSGFWTAIGVFSILLWAGMTVALLVAGVVFALIGGRQLAEAARVMTGEVVNAIVGSVFVWIALPILAVLAIVTVVGLPLGLGVLVFLLPVLGFLGYLVAATRLGSLLTKAISRGPGERPVVAVILGVVILQVLLLVPVVGAIVVFLASIWGAGALAYVAYRGAGGRGVAPEPAAPATTL